MIPKSKRFSPMNRHISDVLTVVKNKKTLPHGKAAGEKAALS